MIRISRRTFFRDGAALAGGGLLARLGLPQPGSSLAAAELARRPLGKTGVEVTALGLGGGGRFFEPVPTDQAGAELVRQAIERGIGFIETAANYGPSGDPNRAERRIGLAMKTHRSRVFLETKTDARDYDGAMREMERSLRLLHTDHVDLMLHHAVFSARDLERMLAADGADKAIRKMVDSKAVRFRGFSCHDPALALQMIERLEPDAIQLPINATRVPDFEAEVLPLARARGIGVVAMKTCGHGFFRKDAIGGAYDSRFQTDSNRQQHRFAPPEEAFERPHPSPDDFTRYALALPIATAVVGLDSTATLEALVRVASLEPLTAAERQSIRERAQVFATTGYWIPRPSQRG
jgi:aryl-alcohol dehydrogenase-like predicted oxidoreductase